MSSVESNNKKFYTIFWVGTQGSNVEKAKKLNEEDTIKDVIYFDDDNTEKCLKCLQQTSNENILLVITGMMSNKIMTNEKVLTQIHNLHQVNSIYVDTKYSNRHPSKLFPKV
jgi:hypothetical protein